MDRRTFLGGTAAAASLRPSGACALPERVMTQDGWTYPVTLSQEAVELLQGHYAMRYGSFLDMPPATSELASLTDALVRYSLAPGTTIGQTLDVRPLMNPDLATEDELERLIENVAETAIGLMEEHHSYDFNERFDSRVDGRLISRTEEELLSLIGDADRCLQCIRIMDHGRMESREGDRSSDAA